MLKYCELHNYSYAYIYYQKSSSELFTMNIIRKKKHNIDYLFMIYVWSYVYDESFQTTVI